MADEDSTNIGMIILIVVLVVLVFLMVFYSFKWRDGTPAERAGRQEREAPADRFTIVPPTVTQPVQ